MSIEVTGNPSMPWARAVGTRAAKQPKKSRTAKQRTNGVKFFIRGERPASRGRRSIGVLDGECGRQRQGTNKENDGDPGANRAAAVPMPAAMAETSEDSSSLR